MTASSHHAQQTYDMPSVLLWHVPQIHTRYYASSYRMIPAAFHGHTLTGMRVPALLQNEDSSCSIRECNTSNTASTPNISDLCTAAAVDSACTMCSGSVLLTRHYWHTSMSTYKGIACLSKRTYRYSHEARMSVLSVEQYHTTYCRPG